MPKCRIKTIQINGKERFVPQIRVIWGIWVNIFSRDQVYHFRYQFQAQEVITKLHKSTAFKSRIIPVN